MMSYNDGGYPSRRGSRRGFKRFREEPPPEQIEPPLIQDNLVQTPPKPPTNNSKRNTKARLFVANIPKGITEKEFAEIFKDYSIAEVVLPKEKGFGFVQCYSRDEAEKILEEMTNKLVQDKPLHIKFCVPTAAFKVKNLNPYVTNELLFQAFSKFGEVDRAVVIADERGKSIGEGIVEFASKRGYYNALQACNEGCLLLTSSIQPVVLEEYKHLDDEGGVRDAYFNPHNPGFVKEREKPPRVVYPGTFEYEIGMRWKHLYELEKRRLAELEQEVLAHKEKINQFIEADFYEHQANMLKEQLKHLEEKRTRIKHELGVGDPWQDQRVGPDSWGQQQPQGGPDPWGPPPPSGPDPWVQPQRSGPEPWINPQQGMQDTWGQQGYSNEGYWRTEIPNTGMEPNPISQPPPPLPQDVPSSIYNGQQDATHLGVSYLGTQPLPEADRKVPPFPSEELPPPPPPLPEDPLPPNSIADQSTPVYTPYQTPSITTSSSSITTTSA